MAEDSNQPTLLNEQPDRKRNRLLLVAIALLVTAITILGATIIWQRAQMAELLKQNAATSEALKKATEIPATDANEGYVVIKEWGVRFKPVEGLKEVEYFKPANSEADSLTFTTTPLAQASPACNKSSGTIVLGLIIRTQSNPTRGGVLAKIGDYYYQYIGPQATCSNGDMLQLENQTMLNISKSLSSLEAAQ